jgi:hypothetical protein
MKITLRIALLVLMSGLLATGPNAWSAEGWSMTGGLKKLFNPAPKAAKKHLFQTPVRVVALWTPAMYNSPGMPPQRGFGGRLFFYNQKDQPVPVEGQLVVYGYNDSAPKQDARVPDRKFVFTAEQLSKHFSPGELGASYSIWIPWDPVGGPQLEISLLPVFTTLGGQVVMGEQSRNLLPGTTTPPPNPRQEQSVVQPIIIDHRVAPASYVASPEDVGGARGYSQGVEPGIYTHAMPAPQQENIRMTSIQLTPGLAERMIQASLQSQNQQQNNPPAQNPTAPDQPPTTTYPLPAQSMPPNVTTAPNATGQNPTVTNIAPQLGPHPASRSFNAPTADSRSWGPVVPRTQAQPTSKPGLATPGQGTPIGTPSTRYAPGSLPAPTTASPLPTSGPQPSAPSPVAPGYPHPSPSQYSLYPSAPAGSQNGWSSVK